MKSGGAEASSELCILQNQRERKMIKKRKKAVAAALGLLMFAAVPASARDYIMGQTWSFDASSAGYLAAQDRGYFKDNGVSVKVQRGIGASDTLRRLITGDVDFAVFDATLLVRAAAADPAAQLTMVANVLQRSSHTAIYVKGRNVKTVGDLAKAKFGNTGGSVSQLFPTFMTYAMKTVGQPSNAFTSVQLDPALRVPALLRGDIDVIAAFTFEMPLIAARAKESGLELAKFDFADYGMNPYTSPKATRPLCAAPWPACSRAGNGCARIRPRPRNSSSSITPMSRPRRFPTSFPCCCRMSAAPMSRRTASAI
jgi:NitT/TauT family transport system substrate-binding protein